MIKPAKSDRAKRSSLINLLLATKDALATAIVFEDKWLNFNEVRSVGP